MNKDKLNIGCGRDIKNPEKGWVNVDKFKLEGVDKAVDLDKYPWPFKENSFSVVYCKDVLEHLEDVIKAMEEIHRILKPGGRVIVHVPYYSSMYAFGDITHKNFFNYDSFDTFTKNHGLNFYSKARFNIKRRKIIFSWNRFLNVFSKIINLSPKIYQRYFSYIFPSNAIVFEMVAEKG